MRFPCVVMESLSLLHTLPFFSSALPLPLIACFLLSPPSISPPPPVYMSPEVTESPLSPEPPSQRDSTVGGTCGGNPVLIIGDTQNGRDGGGQCKVICTHAYHSLSLCLRVCCVWCHVIPVWCHVIRLWCHVIRLWCIVIRYSGSISFGNISK